MCVFAEAKTLVVQYAVVHVCVCACLPCVLLCRQQCEEWQSECDSEKKEVYESVDFFMMHFFLK